MEELIFLACAIGPMAKFTKPIVTEGYYLVSRPDGSRAKEYVSKKRIAAWADNHTKMVSDGLRVPAPVAHSDNERPAKININQNGTPRSDLNSGWWEKMWVGSNKDGTALYGDVDVRDSSISDKVENGAIKDTSIYLDNDWVDGDGKIWEGEHLMHVALVTHPIEKGQDGFTPKSDTALAFGMSNRIQMADNELNKIEETGASEGSMNELIKRLKAIASIAIADSTTTESLIPNLLMALAQKEISDSENDGQDGSTTTPPEGAVDQPAPIAMSLSVNQIKAIVTQKVTNPDTGKQFTEDELAKAGIAPKTDPTIMSQLEAHKDANSYMVEYLGEQKKKELRSRAGSLGSKVSKKYLEDVLAPQIESFQMSFSTSGPVVSTAEHIIGALESQPLPSGLGNAVDLNNGSLAGAPSQVSNALQMSAFADPASAGYTVEQDPFKSGEALSDEDAQKLADRILAESGFGPIVTNS